MSWVLSRYEKEIRTHLDKMNYFNSKVRESLLQILRQRGTQDSAYAKKLGVEDLHSLSFTIQESITQNDDELLKPDVLDDVQLEAVDQDGNNILHYCVVEMALELIKSISQHRPESFKRMWNHCNNSGVSPIWGYGSIDQITQKGAQFRVKLLQEVIIPQMEFSHYVSNNGTVADILDLSGEHAAVQQMANDAINAVMQQIEATTWKLGFRIFGITLFQGGKVITTGSGEEKRVPTNIAKIYSKLKESREDVTQHIKALRAIHAISTDALNNPSVTRDAETTRIYQQLSSGYFGEANNNTATQTNNPPVQVGYPL